MSLTCCHLPICLLFLPICLLLLALSTYRCLSLVLLLFLLLFFWMLFIGIVCLLVVFQRESCFSFLIHPSASPFTHPSATPLTHPFASPFQVHTLFSEPSLVVLHPSSFPFFHEFASFLEVWFVILFDPRPTISRHKVHY